MSMYFYGMTPEEAHDNYIEKKAYKRGYEDAKKKFNRPHGTWVDVNGDGSLWKCSNCNEKSCCRGNFCSDCGSDNRPLKHDCCFADETCNKNPCADCGLIEGDNDA